MIQALSWGYVGADGLMSRVCRALLRVCRALLAHFGDMQGDIVCRATLALAWQVVLFCGRRTDVGEAGDHCRRAVEVGRARHGRDHRRRHVLQNCTLANNHCQPQRTPRKTRRARHDAQGTTRKERRARNDAQGTTRKKRRARNDAQGTTRSTLVAISCALSVFSLYH